MKRAIVLAGLLLCLAAPPASAQPASPEEQAAAIARPAIVFVETRWHGWVRDRRTGEVFGGAEGYRFTTSCSGAVINGDGYVSTASHCVDPGVDGGGGGLIDMAVAELAAVGRVRDPALAAQQLAENATLEGATEGSPIGRDIQVQRGTGNKDRDVAPARVVDLAPPTEGDVALLKVPRRGLPAIELVTGDVAVGTPVLAIGYPGSTGEATDPTLEPSSKNGQVSNQRSQDGHPFYEISAAVTHGMSGGPVVDMRGRIIGVVSQLSPGETQSFNLAASAETLAGLLRDANVDDALGPNDRNYRTGLSAYFSDDYDRAVEYLDAVLDAAPGHPQASRYRTLAVEQGGAASGNGVLVVLAVVCAAVALLAGAGGIALMARRRRAFMAAPTPPYGIPIPRV
ncbi:serine protease [Actinophytocola sp.]|uniref:serine protease n=1 Tax=Actinophytocola sp. TaxID=1872138 RepID=UPI002ED1982F